MSTLTRALHTETLKMKRTLALWLTLLAPLTVAFLQFTIYYQRGEQPVFGESNAWLHFAQQTITFWGLLMLPLFITLETALLANLEHSNATWKQLYALPIPRWVILASKGIIALGLIGLSLFLLWGLILLTGLVLSATCPALGFYTPIPWLRILLYCLLTFLAAWSVIAIHSWVALRWRSFIVANATGILATVAGMVVVNTRWGEYYPWAMPGLMANNFIDAGIPYPRLVFAIAAGLLIFTLGIVDLARRDVE